MSIKVINNVKHYPVSENMRFNLESCHDKFMCMIYELRDAGDFSKEEELFSKMQEADELAFKAGYGWLSGPEYGRAKELVAWRQTLRDIACSKAGVPNMID